MSSKKTLEINPSHPIVAALREKAEKDKGSRQVRDITWMLFDTALLPSGFSLEQPVEFATRIHRLIHLGLSIDDDGAAADDDMDDLPDLEDDDEDDGDDEAAMEQVD
eukprot:TRINITY_DN45413_c0_g1_i1.p2 TRINITY_DN45413_c0_g1~~TRINITY_DN45413_c0_g1_i1.p2  ORF type:complete len:120 (-),score=34.02 TRINITY_DN45413_c0_g1_i1:104-424(-)